MTDPSSQEEAIDLLQQLGLKEYEARSFVALARRQRGTARDISETSQVPRTRVYDAVRTLEAKGLVETQHSSPQEFRAVPVEEGVRTLRSEYEQRTESLRESLEGLEPAEEDGPTETTHDVWTISGAGGITSRAGQLIEGATDEVVLVVGHESVFTDQLAEQLRAADGRGVRVVVGAVEADLRDGIQAALPGVAVFVSDLDWLGCSPLPGDDTVVSRLLLVDREAILGSTFTETDRDDQVHEQAVFGRGFDNGVVAITRRLLAAGLPVASDPVQGDG